MYLADELRAYVRKLYMDAQVTEELIDEQDPYGERMLGLAAAQKSCAEELQEVLESCGEDVGVVEGIGRGS